MSENKELQYSPRKVRERSIILLIVGAVLLLPPFVGISLVDTKLAGIPTPLLYVFAVWIVLIFGAQRLARPLIDGDQSTELASRRGPDVS